MKKIDHYTRPVTLTLAEDMSVDHLPMLLQNIEEVLEERHGKLIITSYPCGPHEVHCNVDLEGSEKVRIPRALR